MKSRTFFAQTVNTFSSLTKPASSKAKPACMNRTRMPEVISHDASRAAEKSELQLFVNTTWDSNSVTLSARLITDSMAAETSAEMGVVVFPEKPMETCDLTFDPS